MHLTYNLNHTNHSNLELFWLLLMIIFFSINLPIIF